MYVYIYINCRKHYEYCKNKINALFDSICVKLYDNISHNFSLMTRKSRKRRKYKKFVIFKK